MWPYPFRCPPATFFVLFTIRINFNNLKRTFWHRQLFLQYLSCRGIKRKLFKYLHFTWKFNKCMRVSFIFIMYICNILLENDWTRIERIFFKIIEQNLLYIFIIRKIYLNRWKIELEEYSWIKSKSWFCGEMSL